MWCYFPIVRPSNNNDVYEDHSVFSIFCPRFAFIVVRADSLVLEGPSPVMLAKGIIIFEVFHIVIQ